MNNVIHLVPGAHCARLQTVINGTTITVPCHALNYHVSPNLGAVSVRAPKWIEYWLRSLAGETASYPSLVMDEDLSQESAYVYVDDRITWGVVPPPYHVRAALRAATLRVGRDGHGRERG